MTSETRTAWGGKRGHSSFFRPAVIGNDECRTGGSNRLDSRWPLLTDPAGRGQFTYDLRKPTPPRPTFSELADRDAVYQHSLSKLVTMAPHGAFVRRRRAIVGA